MLTKNGQTSTNVNQTRLAMILKAQWMETLTIKRNRWKRDGLSPSELHRVAHEIHAFHLAQGYRSVRSLHEAHKSTIPVSFNLFRGPRPHDFDTGDGSIFGKLLTELLFIHCRVDVSNVQVGGMWVSSVSRSNFNII